VRLFFPFHPHSRHSELTLRCVAPPTPSNRALISNFEFEPAYEGQVPQPTAAVTMSAFVVFVCFGGVSDLCFSFDVLL
jgi:hypothetical protein